MKVGIIGLGLMGGSMGLTLKHLGAIANQPISRILGHDRSPLHSQQALSLGLVDECVGLGEIWSCEVVFLCVPVEGIVALLQGINSETIHPHLTLIDMGGAKCEVLAHVPSWLRAHFVSAHPMCGTEFFGPKAAFLGLYENSIVILSDLEQSGELQAEMAKDIFISIGMKILKMDSRSHDQHIALISHMPHILSYALANATLAQEDPEMILALVGGGFRSMSRLSKSSPLMWRDIFKHNKAHVLDALGHFQAELDRAREYLANEEWDKLEDFMANANALQKFL